MMLVVGGAAVTASVARGLGGRYVDGVPGRAVRSMRTLTAAG
jgi:hypothetical protein